MHQKDLKGPKSVVILGAGISGMALAWYLERHMRGRLKIQILEKTPRFGGWLETVELEDFLFERGPRSFRSKGPGKQTLSLIRDLGLGEDIIVASPAAKERYLWMNGKLQALPKGLWGFLSSPVTRSLIPRIFKERYVPATAYQDESVHEFFKRRLGQEAADIFVDAMVSGIFAGDAKRLSMRGCFPQLWKLEQEYGSIIRGMMQVGRQSQGKTDLWMRKMRRSGTYSFQKGVESLVQGIKSQLHAEFRLGCTVQGVESAGEMLRVHTNQGVVDADAVYSTLPANQLANVLAADAPLIASDLKQQQAASVAVVGVGYRKNPTRLKGFGHLIPSREGSSTLGVVWDSAVFPQQNRYPSQGRYSVMLGGSRHPDIVDRSDFELEELASKTMKEQLGVSCTPDMLLISRAKAAIPQYAPGHVDWVDSIRARLHDYHPQFYVGGASFDGVSVNDCVTWAYEASNMLAKSKKSVRSPVESGI